jgi:trigger factor
LAPVPLSKECASSAAQTVKGLIEMEVVEKLNEGLSRSFGVRVPAADLGAALEARIAEILPTLNLKGFRPGKVPAAHVRRLYGKGLMGELVEKTLNETSQRVLADHRLRIAAQPDLKPISDMDAVLAGKDDLAFDIDVEVMPEFEPMDIVTLNLTRPVYRSSDAEIDEELAKVAESNRTYEPRTGKSVAAKDADQVLIDFIGRIDGEAFDGGTAQDIELVLGSGQFIPGFEAQLVGAKPDQTLDVTVDFPADYQAETLRGKTAVFEVTVKSVRAPKTSKVDDALAQQLGLADLTALREAIRENMDRDYLSASRFKTKRVLLDALDAAHDIPLPPRMVEAEFGGIWQQIEKDRADGQVAPEDEGKSDEVLRAEYRKIAERRVRLGLVLAEIGRRADIQVTEAELGDAMRAEAMRYGDQAQQIFDLLRNNPNIQASMRAPIYEDKVVDYILGKATVTEKSVSKEDLLKEDDLPEAFSAAAESPKKTAKKAPAKSKTKPSAEPAAAEAESIAEATTTTAGKGRAKASKVEPSAEASAPPKAAKAKAKPKAG